jgi:hypothetical protein
MVEKLTKSLAENAVTLLAHDDNYGKIVANLIDPSIFEGELRVIAERCVDFWRQNGSAPKAHTQDLVADILDDPANRKAQTYRNILVSMLQLSEQINGNWVVKQLSLLKRTQHLKDAIWRSAERINASQELAITEVEDIWNDLLHTRELDFNPGLRLSNYNQMLEMLKIRHSEFLTGIKELDDRKFVPARQAVTLFLAPTGFGKSWYLIDQCSRAMIQRHKVLHVTLELSEEETMQRYYQRLFAVPKREVKDLSSMMLLTDKFGRVEGFDNQPIHPDFTIADDDIADELSIRVNHLGTRLDNLIIKKFPMRSLTINALRGYLDNLEIVEKFIPDVLALDYIGVTKTDAKNHRLSLGRNGEEFKGLCDERNVAGITAHQTSRISATAENVSMTHIAEDWSLTNSADQVLVYSCTATERKYGLARLYVAKARSEEDHFGVLITQNYAIGQFCISSALLESKYFESLERLKKPDDKDAERDDQDEDDE